MRAIFSYLYVKHVLKKNFFINGNNHPTNDKTPVRDFIYIEDLVRIHYIIENLYEKKNFSKRL